MDAFRVHTPARQRRELAFKLDILFSIPEHSWDDVCPKFSRIAKRHEHDAIGFLANTISDWDSTARVSKAIGILTRVEGTEGTGYLYGNVVDRVAFLYRYFQRNKVRFPRTRVHKLMCILNALSYHRSPITVDALDSVYQGLIKPPTDGASDLRERLKLEITEALCLFLKHHEQTFSTWQERNLDGLRCLLDMAFHPCQFISTLGFCTLMSFSFSAPKRFKLIPTASEQLGSIKDLWAEPGVGGERIALLYGGKVHIPSIERLIHECLDEIKISE